MENPPPPAADPPAAAIKRYAPPNQRNRSHGRRKSGERFDRPGNSYVVDGEKSAPRNIPVNDYRDTGIVNPPSSRLVSLEGCSSSEAYQLLSDRWAAAINSCNDPSTDPSERPVICSESSRVSVSAHNNLPNQSTSPGGSGMDFMAQLQQAMRHAKK